MFSSVITCYPVLQYPWCHLPVPVVKYESHTFTIKLTQISLQIYRINSKGNGSSEESKKESPAVTVYKDDQRTLYKLCNEPQKCTYARTFKSTTRASSAEDVFSQVSLGIFQIT